MSQIKSKDTLPELLVRKFLFAQGLRYRLHDKNLPGKPDIVFTKLKTVVFIHGCFWHGHQNCKYFSIPKTRTIWWTDKITSNSNRDKLNQRKLKKDGWKVIIVYECKLKPKVKDKTLRRLAEILSTG